MSSWHQAGVPLSVPPAALGPAAAKLEARYLTERAAHRFQPATRRRGADYFRSGDVTSCRGNDFDLTATVIGSRLYQVRAEVLGVGRLAVACSCPDFQGGDGCKHLWAVLLQAEQRGLLRRVGGGSESIELVDRESLGTDGCLPGDDAIASTRRPVRTDPPRPSSWRDLLGDPDAPLPPAEPEPEPNSYELVYVLSLDAQPLDRLAVELWCRPSASEPWRPAEFCRERLELLGEPLDRELFMLLGLGAERGRARVPAAQATDLVRRLCAAGRCRLPASPLPLVWDGDEPWRLELELTEGQPVYSLRGRLVRGSEERPLTDAEFLHAGVVVLGHAAAPCITANAADWLGVLLRTQTMAVPRDELEAFLLQYYREGPRPRLELPPSLALAEGEAVPEFSLDVLAPEVSNPGLACRASVGYGKEKISLDARGTRVVDFETRAVYPRQFGPEQQAKVLLTRLGFKGRLLEVPAGHPCWGADELRLPKKRLPGAVEGLSQAGWRVLAQGRTYRRASGLSLSVSTGLDWLELEGSARFDGTCLGLPELIRALARKESTVLLDDGTLGLLPETWFERWGTVAELAEVKQGAAAVRLRRAHVGLVDALLETAEEATWDRAFAALRDELRGFTGLKPARTPKTFVGSLRAYQSEGLAWLEFLARLGFGGCLADDMGLGKTIQVLAFLLGRRREREPSLIVVPRSLVHNWIDEARRFAPSLRLLAHLGSERDLTRLSEHDVLVTSYGTLLRDLGQLERIEFDCVVLDEAQAIKTAGTQTAKAVKALRGAVRLALTGTPVENHLGELWSLFDFLNPGLLGGGATLRRSLTRDHPGESAALLARTIRPFVLRRTKAAVAKELPRRSEETLWVELDREERRRYDELLRYYQASVAERVAQAGVERSTPWLLEALLRLRQAACHPGLIDPSRRHKPSAKLEVLLEQLSRLAEEGHKALVFSQFTSLLAIVRDRLDAHHVAYEYLDGKTRDRGARVARFQQDETIRLFLISLKAGGLGLNLTAADYVFILDPWWNPAVEAQAIDRTHRIGQARHVFAYRLIARHTVEERVAELQQKKRKLVEAILGERSGLAGQLTRRDLEFLLG